MSGSLGKLNLGDSGVSVTQLGFGCARLFAGSELCSSGRLVETALAVGIRHFDTAPSYSWGQSEEVLGAVLNGVSDATIATKVGLAIRGGSPHLLSTLYRSAVRPVLAATPAIKTALLRVYRVKTRQEASPPPMRVLTASEVEKSLQESLARLRRDRIDILLIHEPEHLIVGDDVRNVLERLRTSGVIRAFGLAWGSLPSDGRTLGQVAQHRYHSVGPVGSTSAGVTTIYHGIMRSADQPAVGKPAERVAEVCARLPDCGVLFSASSSSQIREVAAAVKQLRSGVLP